MRTGEHGRRRWFTGRRWGRTGVSLQGDGFDWGGRRGEVKRGRSGAAAGGTPRRRPQRRILPFCEIFQKELTPSDVSKLNRLVIPKKYAVKHFPQIPTIDRDRGSGCRDGEEGATEGIMVQFRDLQGRAWEFGYCYWKSSQSFVFTKGWNSFVKTKQLYAKDIVTFYRCETGACTAVAVPSLHRRCCAELAPPLLCRAYTTERRGRRAIVAWGSWRCSCRHHLLSSLLQVTPWREGVAGLPPSCREPSSHHRRGLLESPPPPVAAAASIAGHRRGANAVVAAACAHGGGASACHRRL
ncbi:hypothetical protein Taro_038700 [Colocasia esculenta]|uniref:TF-B3 domain-containing protein n=1 Tax=Colocasia esculenta TaxID=4460 RepID=A0A843WEL3_COLES|nr:hypothetical protein [Colocasia esculenta]